MDLVDNWASSLSTPRKAWPIHFSAGSNRDHSPSSNATTVSAASTVGDAGGGGKGGVFGSGDGACGISAGDPWGRSGGGSDGG